MAQAQVALVQVQAAPVQAQVAAVVPVTALLVPAVRVLETVVEQAPGAAVVTAQAVAPGAVGLLVMVVVVLEVARGVACREEFSYPTVRQELLSGRREWRWMRICDGRGYSGAESRGRSSRCKPTRGLHPRQVRQRLRTRNRR